jgi:hypothetical protein
MATTSGFWPYTYTTQVGDERDGGLWAAAMPAQDTAVAGCST